MSGLRAGIAGAAILGALALLAVVAASLQGGQPPAPSSGAASVPPSSVAPASIPAGNLSVASIQAGPHVVFQSVLRDGNYAHVSLVPLDAPKGPRIGTGLVCERVYMTDGTGLCLAGEHGAQSRYFAVPFGDNFAPGEPIPLAGSPTFAQVSSDGRYGAASVLTRQVTEAVPQAQTQAIIIDLRAGTVVGDLEDFAITRDGNVFDAPDKDLWGVTFAADSDRFYATLRTAGNAYLVEGSVTGRSLAVLHPNVSAPALSPDGTRVAYAKLISNIGPTFRFHVLDLATGTETPLAEATSIDDQMEWLDDDQLLYGLATDTWIVPSDGSGTPAIFLPEGLSASVVR